MSNYNDKYKTTEDNAPRTRRRKQGSKKSRLSAFNEKAAAESAGNGSDKTAKKKFKISFKKIIIAMACLCILAGIVCLGYVASVISKAPDIDTKNIYSQLSQSSIIYDDEGEIIDNVFGSEGQNRTIVEIKDIPEDLQNAFIALEDKTFRTHNGFNIIRIFGAIKDAMFNGGHISGTSTITQQLARNLYLTDEMSDRTLSRKVTEAYYSVILEKELNKDQILEAYLNTVNFGSGYGVQAAAQAYFSKDASELTLAECAALAAMPQAPTTYALVYQVSANDINDETENLIVKDGDVAYVWNDAADSRMQTCLDLMLEQGYITEKQHAKASKVEIKDMVNPNISALNNNTNYFADYVIKTVIADLQEEYGYDYSKASDLVYNGGLRIYTTMDSTIQDIVEKEFDNESNFPAVIASNKDSDGNILNEYGSIILYAYDNYISSDGYFTLYNKDFDWMDDGSIKVYAGRRLNFYDTVVGDQNEVSVEFKNMYVVDNGTFYSISGGYLNIPAQYKSKDSDGNLIISAEFFESEDYKDYFVKDGKNKLKTKGYTLNQRVIQPQTAMTIIDNKTGYVKAMVGGREVNGRMILNRATSLRQTGSSIKPLAVYAAALQKSYEMAEAGKTFPLVDSSYGKQGDDLWGDYLTAASIIDDEPTTVEGRKWPTNHGGGYNGLVTMRRAMQLSLNICAVKITQQVGIDYSYDLLEKFGITSLVEEGSVNDKNLAALALGGQAQGISTLEMASAYTTFVNEGVHKSYNVYTKVTTRTGDVLLESKTEETKVLDEGVAWIMTDMLKSVVTNGLGSPAAVSGASAGGKTGTTSDQYDIWFDGFTAKYSAALWIGNDVNIKMSDMSTTAARLWGKIMNQIPDVASGTYASRPSNVVAVTVDAESGMLPGEYTTSTKTEYFTKGTQPTEKDTLHDQVTECKESGYLATPSCTSTKKVTGVSRPYKASSSVADYDDELPRYYCNEHNPDPDKYEVKSGLKVTIVQPDEEDEDDDKNSKDSSSSQKSENNSTAVVDSKENEDTETTDNAETSDEESEESTE